jgi:hypothetical protein
METTSTSIDIYHESELLAARCALKDSVDRIQRPMIVRGSFTLKVMAGN